MKLRIVPRLAIAALAAFLTGATVVEATPASGLSQAAPAVRALAAPAEGSVERAHYYYRRYYRPYYHRRHYRRYYHRRYYRPYYYRPYYRHYYRPYYHRRYFYY